MRKSAGLAIATSAAVVAVVIVGFVARGWFVSDTSAAVDCGNYEFPSTAWKQRSERWNASELRIRRQAADAVVDCQLLRGHSRSYVRRLLGPPHIGRTTDSWEYVIGDERGPIVLDSESLFIQFRADRARSAVLGEG